MTTKQAPVGSRWYTAGHHWEVVAEQQHDGEPGVRVRCLTGTRKPPAELPFVTRLLVKRGERVA